MKTLNLIQGSDEWKQTRLEHFTASEAPAMMNASKYQKRSELLHMKKTGISKPVSDFTQRLFDQGHEAEAMARPIAENIIGDELFSGTGVEEIDGLPLLASFDGITMDSETIWEHKLWNESLAKNIDENKIEPHYLWQIAQQLLVSGANRCLFMTSDGTEEGMAHTWIDSTYLNMYLGKEWKTKLMKGWHQFNVDLSVYEPPVELEADQSMQELFDAYAKQKEAADIEAAKLKAIKNEIDKAAESTGAEHIIGNGFKVDLVVRKGTVNYKKIPELQAVNLDDYRNKDTVFYQVKQVDQTA